MMYTRKKILRITLWMVMGLGFSQIAAGADATGYFKRHVTATEPSVVGCPLFHQPDNTLTNLLHVPQGSQLLKFEEGEFVRATFEFAQWDKPDLTLNPGEGAFFLLNGQDEYDVTFTGVLAKGEQTLELKEGLSFVSSKVAKKGLITQDLNLQLNPFDNLFLWEGNGYATYTYLPDGSWYPEEPRVDIGESFFLNLSSPTNWTQTLEVNL